MKVAPEKDLQLDCCGDVDFTGLCNIKNAQDPVCIKSRTRHALTLGNTLLIWASKLQMEIALSATKAEHIALSQSMQELAPMCGLLQEARTALKLDFAKWCLATVQSTIFEE